MFIRKNKPKERKDKILLINTSKNFKKRKAKNYLSEENIKRITNIYRNFRETKGLSKIINLEEVEKIF